jgi:hypothetical protein
MYVNSTLRNHLDPLWNLLFRDLCEIVTQLQQPDGIVLADEGREVIQQFKRTVSIKGVYHSVLPHIQTIRTSRQVKTMREMRVSGRSIAHE